MRLLTRRRLITSVLALALGASASCRSGTLEPGRAILVLISIDGFRWDYLQRFAPPALTRLAGDGVHAEALVPLFPSKTFPNHYAVVTGLTSAHHGIISNNMSAPDIPGRFSMSNREVLADSRWWGGEPIWNTAERQGRIAAAMFWPGSETVIGGRQATYWMPYDDGMPHARRVEQVLEWLRLPDGRRPSFVTLYFSEVDSAGHREGPDSPAVRDAVLDVDRAIGSLMDGVQAAGLSDRVHYVVVSDHGMAAVQPDHVIVLDDYLDPATVDVIDWTPLLALSPKDGNVDAVYEALAERHPALSVYKNADIPARYGALAGHPRLPAVVGIADEGWYITSRREQARWASGAAAPPGGEHGYAAQVKSMHGLFIAAGPRLRQGMIVPPFENLHVYELMCAVLGLEPADNDGDPAVTRAFLR